ncbi:ABC transporter permease subunit [Candidatus Collinsella stercoripullorum]|uniref:ABC transporter permease subunit n=1 Tax=Candidatus Collinsella stercoripullorum TaxID=2838522 RepID=UPI001C3AB72A|nr:ABC transporter permease subunit [Candidatus Collinsella stercoripullorum]HJA01550.1 ABC transporter permease subunit [Candidatus Collinsella stercoripullorum]
MVWPLFTRELRSAALPALVVACVLALYAGVIVSMYDPGLGASLELMRESMPELFAAFGMADQGTTLLEFLVNYLYGFLLVVFPLVLAALLADRLMVRHIERGSVTYLLAQPVSRTRLAISQLLVLLTCMVALMAALTVFELAVAQALFPGELDAAGLLAVNASTLCLWVLFAGVCWASACALPVVAAARWTGVAVCTIFVLAQMLSGVGDELSWLADVTPIALFDPLGVASGDTGAVAGAAALAASGIALFALGTAAFSRRDLSA